MSEGEHVRECQSQIVKESMSQSMSESMSEIVLATVPECHFGSGSRSILNRCQTGGPGFQYSRTVNPGMARWKSPNLSELAGLYAGRPVGPSIDSH